MYGKKSSMKFNQNSFRKQACAILTRKITPFSLHVWKKGTLSVPALHENSELEIAFLSFCLSLWRISETATIIAHVTVLWQRWKLAWLTILVYCWFISRKLCVCSSEYWANYSKRITMAKVQWLQKTGL